MGIRSGRDTKSKTNILVYIVFYYRPCGFEGVLAVSSILMNYVLFFIPWTPSEHFDSDKKILPLLLSKNCLIITTFNLLTAEI